MHISNFPLFRVSQLRKPNLPSMVLYLVDGTTDLMAHMMNFMENLKNILGIQKSICEIKGEKY